MSEQMMQLLQTTINYTNSNMSPLIQMKIWNIELTNNNYNIPNDTLRQNATTLNVIHAKQHMVC